MQEGVSVETTGCALSGTTDDWTVPDDVVDFLFGLLTVGIVITQSLLQSLVLMSNSVHTHWWNSVRH